MRTCPACGEDTKAETTEPCTECGSSPFAADEGSSWDESAWADTPEAEPEALVGSTAPVPAEAQPEYGLPDQPAPAPAPAQKKARVGAVWILLILAGLAWQGFNLFSGCGDIFDSATAGSRNSATVTVTNRTSAAERPPARDQ